MSEITQEVGPSVENWERNRKLSLSGCALRSFPSIRDVHSLLLSAVSKEDWLESSECFSRSSIAIAVDIWGRTGKTMGLAERE